MNIASQLDQLKHTHINTLKQMARSANINMWYKLNKKDLIQALAFTMSEQLDKKHHKKNRSLSNSPDKTRKRELDIYTVVNYNEEPALVTHKHEINGITFYDITLKKSKMIIYNLQREDLKKMRKKSKKISLPSFSIEDSGIKKRVRSSMSEASSPSEKPRKRKKVPVIIYSEDDDTPINRTASPLEKPRKRRKVPVIIYSTDDDTPINRTTKKRNRVIIDSEDDDEIPVTKKTSKKNKPHKRLLPISNKQYNTNSEKAGKLPIEFINIEDTDEENNDDIPANQSTRCAVNSGKAEKLPIEVITIEDTDEENNDDISAKIQHTVVDIEDTDEEKQSSPIISPLQMINDQPSLKEGDEIDISHELQNDVLKDPKKLTEGTLIDDSFLNFFESLEQTDLPNLSTSIETTNGTLNCLGLKY